MADEDREVDKLTGTATTGHEWDGLKELNTPLPRWWLWTFYATIVWGIAYCIAYPAWPLLTTTTEGVLGWHTRTAVVADLEDLNKLRGPMTEKLAKASLQEIANDPQLSEFARAAGKAAFADNCSVCHGAGGGGSRGFPNLTDDNWLWGGKLEDIANTIRHGARANDDEGHVGNMPSFGRGNILPRAQIEIVADYVRSLSGLPVDAKADLAAGRKIFADNCVTCHGDAGKGNRELGAPNLTDAIWEYGSSREIIVETVWGGRGGVMPAWQGRLSEPTIKALTVYVHGLGGGEK